MVMIPSFFQAFQAVVNYLAMPSYRSPPLRLSLFCVLGTFVDHWLTISDTAPSSRRTSTATSSRRQVRQTAIHSFVQGSLMASPAPASWNGLLFSQFA